MKYGASPMRKKPPHHAELDARVGQARRPDFGRSLRDRRVEIQPGLLGGFGKRAWPKRLLQNGPVPVCDRRDVVGQIIANVMANGVVVDLVFVGSDDGEPLPT